MTRKNLLLLMVVFTFNTSFSFADYAWVFDPTMCGGDLRMNPAERACTQRFPLGSAVWELLNPELSPLEGTRPGLGHSRAKDLSRIRVGVIDTGFDYNHSRLRAHLDPFPINPEGPDAHGRKYGIGLDALGGDYFPFHQVELKENNTSFVESDIHGTHVAGLVSLDNPRIRLDLCRAFSDQIFIDEGGSYSYSGTESRPHVSAPDAEYLAAISRQSWAEYWYFFEACLDYSLMRGDRIVNASNGIFWKAGSNWDDSSDEICKSLGESNCKAFRNFFKNVLERARKKIGENGDRLLLVAGAGNDRLPVEPEHMIFGSLDLPNLLVVGALERRGNEDVLAPYSNFGSLVDVYVRGSNIRSAVPHDSLLPTNAAPVPRGSNPKALLSGTSMAAPLVSHLAAKVLLEIPSLTPAQVRNFLLNTAEISAIKISKRTSVRIRVISFKNTMEAVKSWPHLSLNGKEALVANVARLPWVVSDDSRGQR